MSGDRATGAPGHSCGSFSARRKTFVLILDDSLQSL